MDELRPRRAAATDNRERAQRPSRLAERPDRVALWAVALAVMAMIAGAASAHAGSSGGIGGPSGGSGGTTQTSAAGGGDVGTLKWISQLATWYGPGFFGNQTACGKTLTRRTVGVAHKTLPCGSRVVVRYGGRYLRTTVIDRGPYSNEAKWDLTQAAARALGFEYTDEIRVAKLSRD